MPGFVEQTHILTGLRRGRIWLMRCRRRSDGAPAAVEADWRWTLEREERFHDVVGFYHTHPPAAGTAPSRRDVRTMQAWCSALGKPLLCVIGCNEHTLSTRFADDEDGGQPLPMTESFAGGIFVAVEDVYGR